MQKEQVSRPALFFVLLRICADARGVEVVFLAVPILGCVGNHVSVGIHKVPLAAALDPIVYYHIAVGIKVAPFLRAVLHPFACYAISVSAYIAPTDGIFNPSVGCHSSA